MNPASVRGLSLRMRPGGESITFICTTSACPPLRDLTRADRFRPRTWRWLGSATTALDGTINLHAGWSGSFLALPPVHLEDGDWDWFEAELTISANPRPATALAAHPHAIRSNFAAMMKSFSCKPLIFFVCSDTVA